MAKAITQTSERDTRSASPEFDPTAFQAELDQSVNSARELVNSWIPAGFGASSSATNGAKAGGVQGFKDKARPPRMGLGAEPAEIHKQQAEDRKLKDRLLGKGRRDVGDEGSSVKTAPENGMDEAGSESEDEEDSRSKTISKGKAKSNGTLSTTAKDAPNNPFVMKKAQVESNTASTSSTPSKPTPSRLFNDPSPSKPSPAKPSSSLNTSANGTSQPPSASSSRTIAPVSFYDKNASSSKDVPPSSSTAGLSKNQRKKLRKAERDQEVKRKLEEESRKEEALERRQLKRSRDGEDEEEEIDQSKADEIEDVEMTAVVSPNKAKEPNDGSRDQPSKKKKKKKKAKGGNEAAPLLNL